MKISINARLKPYKVQEMVFSCLRSKVAYEDPVKIRDIFRRKGNRDIFNCDLISCNFDIRTKIDKVVNDIVQDMHSPKFYDPQGFMIWKYNTIYISFGGTKNIYDVLDDIDIRPKKIMKDIYVHNGFFEQFMAIEPKITEDIKDISSNYPIERIIFTGHSKGACIATIASAFYADIFPNLFITCHTFAMPRIGNDKFIEWFKSGVDECTRIEIQEDIVPLLPINKDFIHIPNGIKLKKNGSVDDKLYEINNLKYNDILYKLMNKNEFEIIKKFHSMEMHIERLMSFKNIRK